MGLTGFSEPCQIDVNCSPLGDSWSNEKNAVGLIQNNLGNRIGTGTLVMNTCNSNIPYFLTADHVYDPPNGGPKTNFATCNFIFKFYKPYCSTNNGTPDEDVIVSTALLFNGAKLISHWAGSDFCLLKLNTTPDISSNIYYAGWSRAINFPTQSTLLHHPRGDAMKISQSDNPVYVGGGTMGAPNTNFYKITWSTKPDGHGGQSIATAEPGSSGGPLFDQNNRLVAQLQGGVDGCSNPTFPSWFGRFSASWEGGGDTSNRLKDYLDPNNLLNITTNTSSISTLLPPPSSSSYSIEGASVVCNYQDYYIANLPAGATVNWSFSNCPTGCPLILQPNIPVPNQCRVSYQGGYSLSIDLIATISSSLGCFLPLKKSIRGTYPSSSTGFSFIQESCVSGGVSHPALSGVTSMPQFIHGGCTVFVSMGGYSDLLP